MTLGAQDLEADNLPDVVANPAKASFEDFQLGLQIVAFLKQRGFVPENCSLQEAADFGWQISESNFLRQVFASDYALEYLSAKGKSYIDATRNLNIDCLESLCFAFEAQHQPQTAHKRGSFGTPPGLAKLIVENAYLYLKQKPKFILDPALGSGIFILALLTYLQETQKLAVSEIRFLAENCIVGIDRNQLALDLARLLISLRLIELGATAAFKLKHLYCGNSLISRKDLPAQKSFFINNLQPFTIEEYLPDDFKGFDLVLGNPPYGLSRNQQLDRVENELLMERYAWARKGKVNKYLLFLARGYELLAKGGVSSMIVPNSWLGISDGEKFRKVLLEHGSLRELVTFSKNPFRGLQLEPVIVTISKGEYFSNYRLSYLEGRSPYSCIARSVRDVAQAKIYPGCCISTSASEDRDIALKAKQNSSYTVGVASSLFRPLIALQVYTLGKGSPTQSQDDVDNHVFHSRVALNSSHFPYLEGKDVRRFCIEWSGSYLHWGPWIAEQQPLERFCGPRILVREILGKAPYRICACYCEETFVYNKSILHILPSEETGEKATQQALKALTVVLNSKIGSALLYEFGRKSQRKIFPKLVLDDLLSFPLPERFFRSFDKLSELFDTLSGNKEGANELETLADRTVEELFFLP